MSIQRHYTQLAAAVIAAISSLPAFAQEDPDKMIVTASGYSQQLRDAPRVLRLSLKSSYKINPFAT